MPDVEIVTEGLAFPEGPVAMPDGSVIVVEIKIGQLTRVMPDGEKIPVAKVGGGPNGLAVGPDGAMDVCNNGIGLSPDGSKLYAVTTSNAHCYSWDITGPGSVTGGNPLTGGGNLVSRGQHGDLYDSLAIDGEGNVCIATLLNEPGITVVSP